MYSDLESHTSKFAQFVLGCEGVQYGGGWIGGFFVSEEFEEVESFILFKAH